MASDDESDHNDSKNSSNDNSNNSSNSYEPKDPLLNPRNHLYLHPGENPIVVLVAPPLDDNIVRRNLVL